MAGGKHTIAENQGEEKPRGHGMKNRLEDKASACFDKKQPQLEVREESK